MKNLFNIEVMNIESKTKYIEQYRLFLKNRKNRFIDKSFEEKYEESKVETVYLEVYNVAVAIIRERIKQQEPWKSGPRAMELDANMLLTGDKSIPLKPIYPVFL